LKEIEGYGRSLLYKLSLATPLLVLYWRGVQQKWCNRMGGKLSPLQL